jgi:F-type H+-transporting ATPase subunit epsilon
MHLQIVSPLAVEAELTGIVSVRAEDRSGSFVILPGHTDFLTVLAVTVVEWRTRGGDTGHIAVRGGIFRVEGGDRVQIATRQAVSGPSLERLGAAVLDELRSEADAEAKTRTTATRMHMGLMRQLDRYIQTGHGYFMPRLGGFAAQGDDLETQTDE